MKLTFVAKMGAIVFLAMLMGPAGAASAHGQWADPAGVSATTIPMSARIQPAALNQLLHTKGARKPLILQVGSYMLYGEAHIPGSEYAGPGSEAAGLNLLRQKVGSLARNTPIVIYCGCCPWTHCPNIGPAYKVLHEMGFTNLKALYLANNFGTDWVSKGYPVATPQ
jgi:hypothetical protein